MLREDTPQELSFPEDEEFSKAEVPQDKPADGPVRRKPFGPKPGRETPGGWRRT